MTAEQDNRPPVYTENGKTIFRFSSLGGCTRALVLALRGEEPSETPAWMQAKFDQGRVAEDLIIEAWLDKEFADNKRLWRMLSPHEPASIQGLPFIVGASHGQFNAEIPVGNDILIRGKPDGIAKLGSSPHGDWPYPDLRVTLEVKAFGQSYWDKWLAEGIAGFPNYATQVSLQMYATGLECVFVVGRKNEDGVFSGEIDWRRISQAPVPFDRIKDKVRHVVELADNTELPACDVNQYPCPFYHFHDDAPEPQSGPEAMGHLAAEYDEWNKVAKDAEKKKKQASQALLNLLDANPGEKFRVGDWEIVDMDYERAEYVVKAARVRYPKVTWKGAK